VTIFCLHVFGLFFFFRWLLILFLRHGRTVDIFILKRERQGLYARAGKRCDDGYDARAARCSCLQNCASAFAPPPPFPKFVNRSHASEAESIDAFLTYVFVNVLYVCAYY
jgi:hypothetical protein